MKIKIAKTIIDIFDIVDVELKEIGMQIEKGVKKMWGVVIAWEESGHYQEQEFFYSSKEKATTIFNNIKNIYKEDMIIDVEEGGNEDV